MWKYSKFICPMQYLLRHHIDPGALQEFIDYVCFPISFVPCSARQRDFMARIMPEKSYGDCMYYSYNDKCWGLYIQWRSKYHVEVY